jgi:tetraacyldisaccharide 4'-kinase
MQAWFKRHWQSYGLAHLVLIPLSWLYGLLTCLRRNLYRLGWLPSYRLPVPVIVVGNIHVGGTGKTPLVIYLVNALKQAGFHPGVISRGYGGTQIGEVTLNSQALACGDEPLVIARQTQCPVWVNPDRVAAGRGLLAANPSCNVIISDDGLQHLRLKRDIELVMIDSSKPHLHHLLPAGPLREKYQRLSEVDAIIESGTGAPNAQLNTLNTSKNMPALFGMRLRPYKWLSLDDQREIATDKLQLQKCLALAGIGNPQKFFDSVAEMGIQAQQRVFDDHHQYTAQDFVTLDQYTLLMTEKDAVKCRLLDLSNAWYLSVQAEVTTLKTNGDSVETLVDLVTHRLASL